MHQIHRSKKVSKSAINTQSGGGETDTSLDDGGNYVTTAPPIFDGGLYARSSARPTAPDPPASVGISSEFLVILNCKLALATSSPYNAFLSTKRHLHRCNASTFEPAPHATQNTMGEVWARGQRRGSPEPPRATGVGPEFPLIYIYSFFSP